MSERIHQCSMPARKMLSLFWLALAASPAYAEGVITLPAVNVIAEPNTESALTVPSVNAAKQQFKQIAGGATIVDAEEYKAGRASTLADALGYAPGVYVQPRFGSDEARLSIRGSGIQRTFHLRGIQVLQDGVPVNQADGGGDFQAIDPLAARYIEVFRGANALRYGSSTLGGAVNFVSPTGYDTAPWGLRAEAGGFGYSRIHGSIGGVSGLGDSGPLDYAISASHYSQDGFRDHAEQDNNLLFGNLGYRLNQNLENRVYFSVVDSDSELPGSIAKAQLETNPEAANPASIAGNQKRDIKLYRVANKTSWVEGDSRVDASLFTVYKELYHPIFQLLDQKNLDYGVDLRLIRGAQNASHYTLGLTLQRNETTDDRFVNVGGLPGARTNALDQTVNTVALFGEYLARLKPDWAVVAGAQALRTARDQVDNFISAPAGDETRSKDYAGFSPKLGVLYDYSSDIQMFANVSRSFEPPSFAELTSVVPIVGSLRFADAQKATTFELGSRGTYGQAEWDVAFYHSRIDGELLALQDGNGNSLGTTNAQKTIHQGIEAGLKVDFSHFVWRNSYQLNDFNFDGDIAFGDNELAGIPEQFYRTELLYTQGDFFIGPTLEASSGWFVDHANTLKADGYAVLGFKVGSRGKDGFSWYLEGRNLTDKKYAATTGVILNANGLDQAQFLPGDGRSVYVGAEWRM